MENLKPDQFTKLVISDILGKPNPKLRSFELSEEWLAELNQIRDNNFVRQSWREDAVRNQGSMNRPNGLDINQEKLGKLLDFEEKLNIRLEEAKEVVAAHRLFAYDKDISLIAGKDGTFSVQNFIRLQQAFISLRKHYAQVLMALNKVQKVLDSGYRIQERISKDTYFEQLETLLAANKKYKARVTGLSEEKENAERLLVQVLMRWEDVELDDDLLDEIRYFLGWDVPMGMSLREKKAQDKAEEEATQEVGP